MGNLDEAKAKYQRMYGALTTEQETLFNIAYGIGYTDGVTEVLSSGEFNQDLLN